MGFANATARQDGTAPRPLRVLVLDDDSFDRKRLRRWVERAAPGEVQSDEAHGLASFCARLESQIYDLIVADYVLSDGTGLEAVGQLRNSRLNAGAYALLVSGVDQDGLRETSLRRGCDTFLSKSDMSADTIAELLHTVRNGTPTQVKPACRPDGQSALLFWAAQARQRALSEAAGQTDQVLRDAFGDSYAARRADTPQTLDGAPVRLTKGITPEQSERLRLFIDEFLSNDSFDFQDMAALYNVLAPHKPDQS